MTKIINIVYKDKKVNFLDANRGFWLLGTCYKETPQYVHVRDAGNHRYKVPNNPNNIELFEGDKQPNRK